MHVKRRLRLLRDERGTTLAEMVVGMAMAAIVLTGVTTMVISSLHTQKRVSQRVEATQSSRQVLTRLIDELNSSCIMPKIAPVQQASTGSILRFVHANGSAVTPTPTLSVVSLQGTNLIQTDYPLKEGNPPNWVFDESKPSTSTLLMAGVSQISPSTQIFRYYAYSTATGGVSTTPLATPLSVADSLTAIQVGVALQVAPRGGTTETGTPAHIEDSATMRLTAASYLETPSLPCQ